MVRSLAGTDRARTQSPTRVAEEVAIKQHRLCPLPKAGDTTAHKPYGNASSKAARLGPAAQAERIHQLSVACQQGSLLGLPCQPDWKRQMQADRAGVWGGLGGTVCATVMDGANRDGVPGISTPFHTSGATL